MKAIALFLVSIAIASAEEAAVPMQKVTPMTPQAAAAAPEPTLVPGAGVTPEVLGKLDWVQGEAPKEWEPGKVYILECWATWCGPCIAAIPHVNELSRKYQEKGLRVYGIDVWEDGKDKVIDFVKKKGDGMSYPVAYTGKGGAFETGWLKPAGVSGIPHTFVIRDGKLLLNAHPNSLTEEVIESLLQPGEEGVKQALAKLDAAKARAAKFYEAIRAFSAALRTKDQDAMAARLAEMKDLGDGNPRIIGYEVEFAVATKDWAMAEKRFSEIPDGLMKTLTIQQSASAVAAAKEAPETLTRTVAEAYAPIVTKGGGPVDNQRLAELQWRLGDKESAIASIKGAVAKCSEESFSRMGFSPEPYAKILSAMEKGEFPDEETTTAWFREAALKRKSESAPAEKP